MTSQANLKTDTVDRFPDWRFRVVFQPDGHNVRRFRSRPAHDKGALRRNLSSGQARYRVSLAYSGEFTRVLGGLTPGAFRAFDIVERKVLKARHKSRLELEQVDADALSWTSSVLA